MKLRTGARGFIAAAIIGIAIIALVSGTNVASRMIFSSGSVLRANAPFTVTGVNGVYTGRNNSTGQTTSGTSFTTVLSTVVGWMTAGQSVEFIGTFIWATRYDISKSIVMDWTQAIVTFNVAWATTIYAKVTMLGGHVINIHNASQEVDPPSSGGHFIGGVNDGDIYLGSGATDSVFDGIDFQNFGLYGIYGASISRLTVQNCIFHNRIYTGSDRDVGVCLGSVGSNHTFQDIRFKDMKGDALYLEDTVTNCKILRIDFNHQIYNPLYNHSIYAKGAGHEIAYCKSHDHEAFAAGAFHFKSSNNRFHHNDFYNSGTIREWVAISIYAEDANARANDNEIYDNNFTNLYDGIWLDNLVGSTQHSTLRTKIHDNVFTNVENCIYLTYGSQTTPRATCTDTKVYYNDFQGCAYPFTAHEPSWVENTAVAYNYFDTAISPSQLQSMQNSMSYQNSLYPPSTTLALPNFNYSLVNDPISYYYVAPR